MVGRKFVVIFNTSSQLEENCSGQCQVVSSNQKTDYTCSPAPLGLCLLIPLSVVRALKPGAMF